MKGRVVVRVAAIAALAALAGCHARSDAPVLLFAGTGTSPNDVRAIETLLRARRLEYAKLGSSELDALDAKALRAHRLLIMPGGNFEEMGNHLQPATTARIRAAVNDGLNYLGICAGAFIAGASPYNGINLTNGVRFPFYSAEDRGIRKAAIPVSTPDSRTLEHYWEDGPQLSGWGSAIAKYPDGTPAVAQGRVGRGWVVLLGTHPEAPENWRDGMTFTTPAEDSNAYASQLIGAAFDGAPLPGYSDVYPPTAGSR